MGRYDLAEESPSFRSKREPVDPTLPPAQDPTPAFHPSQKLRHVSLGDQERVRKLLLRYALLHSHMREHIELGVVQPPHLQLLGQFATHLQLDPEQSQPR